MRTSTVGRGWAALATLALVVGVMAPCLPSVSAEEGEQRGGPKVFATPEAFVEAWIEASRNNDDGALRALAGPKYSDLIQPGGDPSVAKVRATFVEETEEYWTPRDNEDGSKTLVIGDGRWPFPMPFRQMEAGWTIDIEAGMEEMRMRRIGFTELSAIKLCRVYASAQEEYREKDRDGDGVREYAQRMRSTPGTQDGLWWPDEDFDEASPLGPLVAAYETYLRNRQSGDPVSGYYWKIVKGQGPRAPGGHHSYVINGNMIAGFALIGIPAQYGESGIMTFLVSHHGKVLQKDLGVCTPSAPQVYQFYNPDDSWTEVED